MKVLNKTDEIRFGYGAAIPALATLLIHDDTVMAVGLIGILLFLLNDLIMAYIVRGYLNVPFIVMNTVNYAGGFTLFIALYWSWYGLLHLILGS